MNYERLVQWLAGPVAAAISWGATSLVHSTITHSAAVNAATAIVTALVVLAAHFKWLDNLTKWWQESGVAAPAGLLENEAGVGPEPPASKYVNQASDYTPTPSGPDKSGIPRGDITSAVSALSTTDEFDDQPADVEVEPDTPDTPAATDVTDVTAGKETAPEESEEASPPPEFITPSPPSKYVITNEVTSDTTDRLRAQLRAAGIEPEA